MNKELQALYDLIETINAYNEISNNAYIDIEKLDDKISLIENALKELEEYKKCIDLKEAQFISTHNMSVVDTETFNQLAKNSQALEIIKRELVLEVKEDNGLYRLITYQTDNHLLRKDQYDLLKGVCK